MVKITLLSLTTLLFLGCSSIWWRDKDINSKPLWTNDAYVGSARISASGRSSDQKIIALKRAISVYLITKGSGSGEAEVNAEKIAIKNGSIENISKHFSQNYKVKFSFKNQNYNLKISNIWQDPITKELFVKVKEN